MKDISADKIARLERAAERVKKAIEAAYCGSAENGSFFRQASGEYVPSVFMLTRELDRAIADLK